MSTATKTAPHAKVPMAFILSDLDDACLRLFAFLDAAQFDAGLIASVDEASRSLGWTRSHTLTHLHHLHAAGIVGLLPDA